MQRAAEKQKYGNRSLRVSGIITGAVLILAFAYLFLFVQGINLSVVALVLAVSAAVAAFAAAVASVYSQKNYIESHVDGNFPLFAVACGASTAALSGLAGYLCSFLVADAFKGMVFTAAGVSFFAAGFAGIVAYLVSNFLYEVSQKKVSMLLLTILISGFFVSAIKNNDHNWWRDSLCALGMPVNGSPLYYNVTLVLISLLSLALGMFLKPQVRKLAEKGHLEIDAPQILRILYLIAAFNIAVVGLLPYGVSGFLNNIHIFFANYVFLHIGIIMLASYFLFQKFSKKFLLTSYAIFLLAMMFYSISIANVLLPYALIEIVIVIFVIAWIAFLFKNIRILSEKA